MTTKAGTTPNNDRSNVKNPNNPAYEADRQNRVREGHENAPPAAPAPSPAPKPTSAPKK